ncbi:MAG: ATP-binding protein [Chloroflexi bacterium]|nr:ATP-binding protein [Chloroflexota bacterium]
MTILPDAGGVFDAIARIGYAFEQAIADLVDNSIDAKATNILVRFFFNSKSVYSVAILDNGNGMAQERIDQAMAFGARTGKTNDDLGKYGMGLKSASFSQCNVLTVISRCAGGVAGRRWTAENVRQDWLCESVEPAAADRHLRENGAHINIGAHGTMIQWDRLDSLTHSVDLPSSVIKERFLQLAKHLGLVFHQFIESGAAHIWLDAVNTETRQYGPPQEIAALNPFPRIQGAAGYPRTFTALLPDSTPLAFTAHIWRRHATDPGFTLGGGRRSNQQGFYIYRNKRLIQPGGWNGLRSDSEVHTSLARVRLDIPPALDSLFKPTVQKSSITMPEPILRAIRDARAGNKTFPDFLSEAEATFRSNANTVQRPHGLIPVEGFDARLALRFENILGVAVDAEDTVNFAWQRLPPDEFFRIDTDQNTIILNARYRKAVLNGYSEQGRYETDQTGSQTYGPVEDIQPAYRGGASSP